MDLPRLQVDFNDAPLSGEAPPGLKPGDKVRLWDADETAPEAIAHVYEIVDGKVSGRWAHCRVDEWCW